MTPTAAGRVELFSRLRRARAMVPWGRTTSASAHVSFAYVEPGLSGAGSGPGSVGDDRPVDGHEDRRERGGEGQRRATPSAATRAPPPHSAPPLLDALIEHARSWKRPASLSVYVRPRFLARLRSLLCAFIFMATAKRQLWQKSGGRRSPIMT